MTHHFHPKVYQKLIIFSNTLLPLNWPEAYMCGKKAKTCLSKSDITVLCRLLRALVHNTHLMFSVGSAGKSLVPM